MAVKTQNPADVHPILQSCLVVWYYDVLRYVIAVHPHIIRKFVIKKDKNVFQFSMISMIFPMKFP